MAPWNRAPPVSFTDSPTRRPLRSQASRDALAQAQQHQQPESIRSVTPLDDRPPSFHSGGHERYVTQQEAYRAVEEELNFNPYDGYASPPPGSERFTPAPHTIEQLYMTQEEDTPYREVDTYDYQPRTQVDMDLHLDQAYRQGTPASYYSHDNPAHAHAQHEPYRETYDDYDEYDDEKEDKFEDSFEGGVEEWQEKEAGDYDEEEGHDGGPLSPAISFRGGFGLPPQTAHTRRNIRDARRVKLTGGNLVLDRPLPTRLAKFLPRKTGDEFLQSRYSAVTASPDGFNQAGYTLRPTLLNRDTELMIVVTIYNEDAVLFCRTMHGIQKNIAFLCSRKNSATWGPDGWKKIVVCIVADGRKAIHPRVLDVLSTLGVYQEGVATNQVGDKDVQAHVFEHTTQSSINSELKLVSLEKGIQPCQVIFCLKEKNAKKLNSHRWALNAFAPQLDPNVVILIDAGTKPGPKSIYKLWKAFDRDSNVGGACGEICTMKGKLWSGLLNPLVAAQNFEYKISNILDKPTESFFGYITVLPGAFSAYRYRALRNDDLGHGPLNSYFKGEHLAGADADVFTSNMYLAEDRILCWELVAKRGEAWVLKYVAGAQGETDVPDQFSEWISQRRRWLNGSFFASAYAIRKTFQLRQSDHSRAKQAALYCQALYNVVNLAFAWFALASYWIFFQVLTTSLEDSSFNIKGIKVVNKIMQSIYMGNVVACFLFSMGNKPKSAQWKYMTSIVLFALCACYMYVAAVYCLYKALVNGNTTLITVEIVISLASTYGAYVLSSVIALDPAHLVTSFLQYMLLSPVYINLLNIYAFSNLHDFSWGTKNQTSNEVDLGVSKKVGKDAVEISLPSAQDDVDSMYDKAIHNLRTLPMIVPAPQSAAQLTEAKQEYYASVRTNVLLAWVLTNGLLVVTILQGDYSTTFSEGGTDTRVSVFVVVVLCLTAVLAVIRLVGSTAFQVEHAVRVAGGHWKAWKGRKRAAKEGRAERKVGTATPKLKGVAAEDTEEDEAWTAN